MSTLLAKLGIEIASSLAPLVAAGIVYGISRLAGWLKAKTHNEQISGAIDTLDNLMATVVKGLQQTMVSAIKEAAADGKITEAEKIMLRTKALEELKKIYGERGLAVLQELLGLGEDALMSLLTNKLEAAVYNLKGTK